MTSPRTYAGSPAMTHEEVEKAIEYVRFHAEHLFNSLKNFDPDVREGRPIDKDPQLDEMADTCS